MARVDGIRQILPDGTAVLLRSAAEPDAPALAALTRDVVAEGTHFGIMADELPETQEAVVADAAAHPRKLILVAEVGDEIVGVLELLPDPRRRAAHCSTVTLLVRRDQRRRGVGSALLEAMLRWVSAVDGIEKLALSLLETNVAARALYERFGFVEEGKRRNAIRMGENRYVDEILMFRWSGSPPCPNASP